MTMAPTPPITAAFQGVMMCADAVMATSPASEAFMIVTTSGRRSSRHVSAIPASPPNVAASVVFRMIAGTSAVRPNRLPPLNPYHPTHSTNTPSVVSGK